MKYITGFEGQYSITRDGKVFSHKTGNFLSLRGSGMAAHGDRRHKRKYKTVALWKIGKGYVYFYVHRLVAAAFIANPLSLPMVNHKDGNPENNNVSNLEWCTHKENCAHAYKNGLTTRGAKNSSTKLTEEDVLKIRDDYKSGRVSQSEIAKRFRVSQSNIYMIVNNKSWQWIKEA